MPGTGTAKEVRPPDDFQAFVARARRDVVRAGLAADSLELLTSSLRAPASPDHG